MRVFLIALLMLAMTPFDLPSGKWTAEGLSIEIGAPETRRMKWTFQQPAVTLTGTYKVTAVKDSHHTTFLVSGISPGPSARFGKGFVIHPGDEVRTIFQFHDHVLNFTMFDREISPVLTLPLEEEGGERGISRV